MREQEPRLHDDDFDQRFAEIIASLEQDPDFARDADPQAIDAPPADRAPGDAERAVGDAGREPVPQERPGGASETLLGETIPVWRGAYGPTFDEALDAEDDEHFIPPPPAPLPPQDDLHFWAMLLGLIGGPLILVWLVVFNPNVGEWWTWLSLSMCVGGFVLLVLRGPRERGPGNGAVV
ncbi:MAG: hypothetical protein V9G19_04910 [Tetrasphaera sp.]